MTVITHRVEWPGMVSEYTVAAAHGGVTVTRPYQVGIGFSGHRGLVREMAGRAVRRDVGSGAVYVTGDEPITWLEVQDPTEALEIYPCRHRRRQALSRPSAGRSPVTVGQTSY
jgi:AraC family transcriptional regulator